MQNFKTLLPNPISTLTSAAAVVTLVMLGASFFETFVQTAQAQAPQQRKKRSGGSSSQPIPESLPQESTDAELADLALNDSLVNSLQPGKFSLAVAFPNGGALTGTQAMGLRGMFTSQFAASLFVQYNYDKAAKKQAAGATLKVQQFLTPTARAVPYLFVQTTAGKNSGDGNTGNTDLQAGVALGLGVEIFLIKEISTSAEVGLGTAFRPSSRLTVATATTQIGLHYHFGLGY